MITEEEVKHIAKLARLGLSEGEIKKFQKELKAKEIKLDIRNTQITSLEGIPLTVTELAVGN